MKTVLLLAMLIAPAIACAHPHSEPDPTQAWWDRVSALCGNAYAGEARRAPAGDDSFAGQTLVMHVRDCTRDRIRIPFVVGDNLSRTWVLTRHGDRIELKHDHRHEDGSEEAVTQYGGITSNAGSSDAQMFPADDATRLAIAGSGQRSVWVIEIEPGQRFVYAANRVGTDRGFLIEFDLSRTVDAPDAPWGWED